MADQDTDKSEQATPHKLEEARKRGQVSKSVDVNSVVMLTAFVVIFAATLDQIGGVMVNSVQRMILSSAVVRFDQSTLLPWMGSVLEPMLLALSPLLIGLMVCAVATNVLQTGPVLSAFPMKPDFSRLNPANGLKRIFNMRTLFELTKMLVKTGLVGGFVYWGFNHLQADLSIWAGLPARSAPRLMRHLFMLTVGVLLAVFVVVALMDLMFSKREFMKKMRMSKRELKDEYKRREGDPEIRARRRRLHSELRKRAMAMRKVKDADVVLVNPVHYAVALRYRPGTMVAPTVLAMGAGALAWRIRERARRHSIPVVPNQALARLLFKSSRLGEVIPQSCYQGVAAVYRRLLAAKAVAA
jgi:flagellar biosynthetic protein FlhB